MAGAVTVCIVGARGLRKADWAGLSDPYCKCEIAGKDHLAFKTKYIEKTLEPRWNHVQQITGCTPGDELGFTVYDWDRGPKPDDLLGRAHLETELIFPNGFDGELRLRDAGDGQEAYLRLRVSVGEQAPVAGGSGQVAAGPPEQHAAGRPSGGSSSSMLGTFGKKVADSAAHGLGHGFGGGIGMGAANRIWSQVDGAFK